MKTFTKIALVTLGLTAGSLYALDAAPTPNTNEADPRAGRHLRVRAMLHRRAALRAHAVRKLDLSADQISQLKAARAETRASLQAIRGDSSLTPEQKRAKARETLQATRGKMRSVLTADQQEKLGKMRERPHQFRRGGR